MLTGDQRPVAEAIARESAVDEVFASLLPEDKVKIIRALKQQSRVMMVGDGVNDAPPLVVSDLGVAMGAAGTDAAMETTDVVLIRAVLGFALALPLGVVGHEGSTVVVCLSGLRLFMIHDSSLSSPH